MTVQDELRKLPSIDRLLASSELAPRLVVYGHDLALEAARATIEGMRQEILAGMPFPGEEQVIDGIIYRLEGAVQPTLRPVINATGVILHTNLGRAPLSEQVLEAMQQAGRGYSNLEFDLQQGRRGSRYVHTERLLCRLCGAEAALVVNNNAGAVLLVLSALAQGRQVIISRGQLVEIGGGFRIPDVMAQSGAQLVEVGTTNRTYLRDFEAAITYQTAALLRVHSSNFRLVGFTHQPDVSELAELAHARDLLMFDDLGSGTLIDTQPFGLEHEPMVQESVAAGADIVTFSGDKLLGGPQAGIIVGKADLIARLREFPLTRALRVDKTTLAGIQANLLHYVKGEALSEIPVWRMIAMSAEDIGTRARALLDDLGEPGGRCEVIPGRSMVGGGSLPEESLPTMLIALPAEISVDSAQRLRLGEPSIVARMMDERLVIDLRTVLPQDELVLEARLGDLLQP